MYKSIIDPKTNKKHSIFSNKGISILKIYNNILYGGKKKYFRENNTLNANQKKYCRCVLHVAKRNTRACNRNKNWGNKCYNPYAVCAKTTKTSTGSKPCQYNFLSQDIPNDEIVAYLDLNQNKYNKKTINRSQSIDNLRVNLHQWYSNKYNF